MANWFTKLFTPASPVAAPAVPEVKVEALPMEQNPSVDMRVKRAAGRCATLMEAIAATSDEEQRKALQRSLTTYQAKLVAAGLDVPETPADARRMMEA